jgi:two-component system nitrogen regulation response regulator GlnG
LLATGDFELVLLDNRMPGLSGIEFLNVLKEKMVTVPVILMTAHGTAETAIRAMNRGAFDYVIKPTVHDFDEWFDDELAPVIVKAREIGRPRQERVRLPGEVETQGDAATQLLGKSKVMQAVCRLIGKVADSHEPVLIRGETGTGKELIAQAIHDYSPRKDGRFVAMNCTALNENLLDDELFGHEKGAFSGAEKFRKGRFEYADGGTLFLDEVGDMTPALQAKLLRVLENREIVRVGGNETIRVDVRVISATHRDLQSSIQSGEFRRDLFYRLNGVTVEVPPLRERGIEDLKLLAGHFLKDATDPAAPPPVLDPGCWAALQQHSWPGNVRELKSVLRRASLVCRGARIMPGDLDIDRSAGRSSDAQSSSDCDDYATHITRAVRSALKSGQRNLYEALIESLERGLLDEVLAECDGNQSRSAARLGISRTTLREKMKKFDLL